MSAVSRAASIVCITSAWLRLLHRPPAQLNVVM